MVRCQLVFKDERTWKSWHEGMKKTAVYRVFLTKYMQLEWSKPA